MWILKCDADLFFCFLSDLVCLFLNSSFKTTADKCHFHFRWLLSILVAKWDFFPTWNLFGKIKCLKKCFIFEDFGVHGHLLCILCVKSRIVWSSLNPLDIILRLSAYYRHLVAVCFTTCQLPFSNLSYGKFDKIKKYFLYLGWSNDSVLSVKYSQCWLWFREISEMQHGKYFNSHL